MTNEQWLVYLWSIYPNGGYTIIYGIMLILSLLILIVSYTTYLDAVNNDNILEETLWVMLGKWKIIIPFTLCTLLVISNLIPSKQNFMYIVATPYVVDTGKSIIESLQDPTSKAYKINQIMDKTLDKAIVAMDKATSEDTSNTQSK